jgi:hypothetical protein
MSAPSLTIRSMKTVLVAVYLMFGVAALFFGTILLLKPDILGALQPGLKLAFAILVLLYGLFRIYTAIRTLRAPEEKRVVLEGDKQS